MAQNLYDILPKMAWMNNKYLKLLKLKQIKVIPVKGPVGSLQVFKCCKKTTNNLLTNYNEKKNFVCDD